MNDRSILHVFIGRSTYKFSRQFIYSHLKRRPIFGGMINNWHVTILRILTIFILFHTM